MRSLLFIASVLGSYSLLRGFPAEWPAVIRVILSTTIFLIGTLIWGRGEKNKSPEAPSPKTRSWLDSLAIITAVLVLEGVFLLFFSATPEKFNALAGLLDETLHPESSHSMQARAEEDSSGNTTTSGNWLWNNTGSRKLGGSGKIRPSNRPEVYLWPQNRQPFDLPVNDLYLRTFTLAQYEKGSWNTMPIIPQGFTASDRKISFFESSSPLLTYEISHQANLFGQSLLVGLPSIANASLPSVRMIAPDTFRLPPLAEEEKSYRYQVQSSVRYFDPKTDLPGKGEDPSYLAPSPDNTAELISTLAGTFKGSPAEQLAALPKFLQERCRYALETKFTKDSNILLEFLNQGRPGYCEHFATAGVLLAREIGFPARIAYGWSGGKFYPISGLYLFRAKEAHAWTEVFVQNKGWVILETTPSSRFQSDQENDENPIASWLENEELLDFPERGGNSFTALPPWEALHLPALGTIGFGGLLFLGLQILKCRSPFHDQSSRNHLALPPAPTYITQFQKSCDQLGIPMSNGHTLRAQLERLRQINCEPDFSSALLSYHYGLHYYAKPKNKRTERQLIRLIKNWSAQKTP